MGAVNSDLFYVAAEYTILIVSVYASIHNRLFSAITYGYITDIFIAKIDYIHFAGVKLEPYIVSMWWIPFIVAAVAFIFKLTTKVTYGLIYGYWASVMLYVAISIIEVPWYIAITGALSSNGVGVIFANGLLKYGPFHHEVFSLIWAPALGVLIFELFSKQRGRKRFPYLFPVTLIGHTIINTVIILVMMMITEVYPVIGMSFLKRIQPARRRQSHMIMNGILMNKYVNYR
jgi:hypothetical protein